MSDDNTLPSRFQVGDEVTIRCTVKAVRFDESKVSYELAGGTADDGFYFHGINSDFVSPAPATA